MTINSVAKCSLMVIVVVFSNLVVKAEKLELPPNSCVDYISVNNESEIDCTWKWSANMGTGEGDCPLNYSVKIGGVVDLTVRDAGGHAYDGRHTGLLGVLTVGIAELIWQVGIKSFSVKDAALMEVKSNYRYLNAHRCR
jgi:hypothetical protein